MISRPQESLLSTPIITLYGTAWCLDSRRAVNWLDAHDIQYTYINIDHDTQAAAYVLRLNDGMRSVPTIVFPDGTVLVEPSQQELARQVEAVASTSLKQSASQFIHGANDEHISTKSRSAAMTHAVSDRAITREEHSYPRFAAYYNRLMQQVPIRLRLDPLRHATAGRTYGVVLEVGAGGGQNFPFYNPAKVASVEAIEPDPAMVAAAQSALGAAPVSITLTKAAVEELPFPDAHFDSAVVSLVFCSVAEPDRGLRELWRVLKPGASVFFLEHVRAQGRILSKIQDALVPVTTRGMGNCHWNRDTLSAIQNTGFQTIEVRQTSGGLQPILCIHAARSETA